MEPLLQGRVAIITGAGHGIGAAAAQLLAREGAAVVVSALHPESIDEVAGAIRRDGGRALAIAGDLTDPELPRRLVSATVEEFGRLDILVDRFGMES